MLNKTFILALLLSVCIPSALSAQKYFADPEEYRQNSIGFSVGSTFAAPLYIASVHGTYAPWKGSFFALGLDAGFGIAGVDAEHFSLSPHIHFNLLVPFPKVVSWYAGIGGSLMIMTFIFPEEGKIRRNIFAADVTTGFIFRIGITVSYTFRTDFDTADNKVAVGYLFRFK
jgi:hypothetical protein